MESALSESTQHLIGTGGGKRAQDERETIFLDLIKKFRGPLLAPFAPKTCPYPEDWSFVSRIVTMPSKLRIYLTSQQKGVYERVSRDVFSTCFL